MLFNSEAYLFFLPVTVGIYWILPIRLRVPFLLVASYVFYASWNAPFLLLILGLTVANYAISRVERRAHPGLWLVSAVGVNLVALGIFKYLGFLDSTANQVAAALGLPAALPAVHLVLPLGISFFAFEFIHYQVDLHRGNPPIDSPVRFALFPAFFPTQIAGPIKRYEQFDAQVLRGPRFQPEMFVGGLELIALGLLKKVALADRLSPIANQVFGHSAKVTSLDAAVGLLAFSLQIYFDFSGYTDIGRGSAQLLGFRVPINFSAPYLATSFQDFWRRWHMSLSSWLRDYVYIPLGGSRQGTRRNALNLLATMALGGLWHGAAWHFVFWGTAHGTGLAGQRLSRGRLQLALPPKARLLLGWLGTQVAVVALWGFFRAGSVGQGAVMLGRVVTGARHLGVASRSDALRVVLVAAGLLAVQLAARQSWLREPGAKLRRVPAVRAAALGSALALGIFFATAVGTPQPFIYFQF